MRDRLYFRVLGPVAVERQGRPLRVRGPQRRALLSLLLLQAGRVVSVDELVDGLWGDRPPPSFRVQLQGMVSELRRTLAPDGVRASAPIETCAPGYRLSVPDDQVDLGEFVRDLAHARARLGADDPATAAVLLHRALARWRGPAFADISSSAVQQAAVGLAEARLSALEDRIEADLGAGSDHGLVAELRELVRSHPLRERFHGQLMIALSRAGRVADSLAVFRDLRTQLVEELGVEPSAQLQQLHRALLAGTGPGAEVASIPASAYVIPRQLPASVPRLVGRDAILDLAVRLLSEGSTPGSPACLAVTGPGGIGKTALVVAVAHRLRDMFRDGQLYARLGASGGGRRSAGAVLSRFLHGLGVPPTGVPTDLGERSGLLRELLAGRRVLVVLDDVTEEEQLRALLPAESRCAVLVTSRRRLSGVEQVRSLPLDVLDPVAGMNLLRAIAGGHRIDAEPQAAAEVVRLCGGLPLALRICAGRLGSRPNWTVADLAQRLAAGRDRLDWLELGDLGVRASLAGSHAELDDSQRLLFRRLGLLGTAEFPAWVPAALLDVPPGTADRVLDSLVDVHLVEPAGRGVTGPRYRLHDLIHLFTVELAGEERSAADRAALDRVLHGWFDLTVTADAEIPHWCGLDPEPAPRWRTAAEDHAAVRADPYGWLDEERDVLVSVVRQAADEECAPVAWPLAQRMSTYLELHGHYDQWADVLRHGLRAAQQAADRQGEACMLGLLLDAEANRDRLAASAHYAERALVAYQALAEEPPTAAPDGEPRPGRDHRVRSDRPVRPARPVDRSSRPEPAELEKKLIAARHAGNPLDIGLAAYTLVLARREAGEHGGYLALFEEIRDAFAACGAGIAELWALKNLGLIYLRQRRLDEAATALLRAYSILSALGDNVYLADITADIGFTFARQGRFDEAESLVGALLARSQSRHRWDEGRAMDALGKLKQARGDKAAAIKAHLRALDVWRQLGARPRIAHSLTALVGLYEDTDRTEIAEAYRRELAALTERPSGRASPAPPVDGRRPGDNRRPAAGRTPLAG